MENLKEQFTIESIIHLQLFTTELKRLKLPSSIKIWQQKKLGDSLAVTVHSDDRQEPQLVLQTSDIRKNFDCWYSVMQQPEGDWYACMKH